jgi:branched-chain amino acid transport system substrate-binding protein
MRSKRSVGIVAVLAATTLMVASCGDLDESSSDGSTDNVLKVGLVVPITGGLSAFGEPDQWVADQMTDWFADHPIEVGDKKISVEIVVKDSQSDPKRAGEVAAELINSENVDVLMALSTPETTVPVTQQCEANAVACITGDTPWQPWFYGSGGKDDAPLKWSHHFFWGLEDVAAVFTDMWDQVPTNKKVAALFPNDSDGTAWAGAIPGMVEGPGYTIDDPGQFPIDTQDFSSQIAQFKKNGDEVLMGVLPPPVFAAFWQQAKQQGFNPKVVTVGKALEFPSAIEALGDLGAGLGVEVWWSPEYPTKSSLTGLTSAEFAASYTEDTGKQWTMPLAFPETLFEVLNAAVIKAGSTDSAAINDAMTDLKVDTLVGPLDWSAGPNPNVAKSMLTGGQWAKSDGGDFPLDLTLVSNSISPSVPTAGTMQPLQ